MIECLIIKKDVNNCADKPLHIDMSKYGYVVPHSHSFLSLALKCVFQGGGVDFSPTVDVNESDKQRVETQSCLGLLTMITSPHTHYTIWSGHFVELPTDVVALVCFTGRKSEHRGLIEPVKQTDPPCNISTLHSHKNVSS